MRYLVKVDAALLLSMVRHGETVGPVRCVNGLPEGLRLIGAGVSNDRLELVFDDGDQGSVQTVVDFTPVYEVVL